MELLKKLTILSLLFFYSCSKSQDSKDASEGDDIEMVDGEESSGDEDVEVVDSEEGYDDEDEEFAEDGDEDYEDEEFAEDGDEDYEDDEELAESDEDYEDDEELAEDEGVEELEAAEDMVADSSSDFESLDGAPLSGQSEMPVAQEAIPAPVLPSVNIADAGPTSTYSVQPNETLMLISFKLYGDYTRWKEIKQMNSDKLGGSTVISPGMQLSYNTQGSGFVWNPQGRPYLIQRGDTLGIISDKVYNTMSKWRKIWDNNKPLIKDPNKIYAGFTLYYVPEDGRDLASEQMKETASAPAAPQVQKEQPMPQEEESFEEEDFPEEI